MTDAVAREPMVRKCVSVQTDALGTLERELNQLSEGLVGVLRPETPPGNGEDPSGKPENIHKMPPLGEDLVVHTRRIEDAIVFVKDLNDRLEI